MDEALRKEFKGLWAEAEEIWTRQEHDHAFHGYVSADFDEVLKYLLELRGQVSTFVEWGSGLGVVTIMAARLGFEAYGIEAEAKLVTHSRELAHTYGPEATFAEGSFIPDEFEWTPSQGDESIRTIIDAASGYEQLELELQDFELIYVYPWPDEHTLCHNIIRQFGHPNALLLSYDAREGMNLKRFAPNVEDPNVEDPSVEDATSDADLHSDDEDEG